MSKVPSSILHYPELNRDSKKLTGEDMIDKSNISIKLSVLGYAIFGTGMTLANKECMKKYPYPEALLVFQVTLLIVLLFSFSK